MFDNLFFKDIKGITLGIDVGSTTVKVVLIKDGKIVYNCYERHMSEVRKKTVELVSKLKDFVGNDSVKVCISGSAGLGLANATGIPFVQEVFSTSEMVKTLAPDTGVVIELGGEDAKVIFFKGITDERMNGTCAGGTGAFIDQMATLLNVDNDTLDELSLKHEKIYSIASRCGVFAKSDVQPLINQGAKKEDIAASIYQAVVNQTISGLVQGYEISGKVMFLGGPLHYCKGLRDRFVKTLGLSESEAIFPEYALVSVALGCALLANKNSPEYNLDELIDNLSNVIYSNDNVIKLEPLFGSDDEYNEFVERHAKATVPNSDINTYCGEAYLGIDCGSTTTKLVLLDSDNNILYNYYGSNRGNPTEIIKEELIKIYEMCGDRIKIASGTVTGYGEELIKHAFGVDNGIVETMAHFYAARHFKPDVDFILDIGGQDIKCFKIHNNAIDNIMLNEACSSGCGSFIETFANIAGYPVEEFAKLALKAKNPVDLGSRCTVFMNSSVKQAQKDGADVSDISAGLSVSVVKNAIYKVIRANNADELGKNIVVQGGTFLNNAILRSFEKEIGRNVVRPAIAGLMGAYGAALYAKAVKKENSSILSLEELNNFTQTVKAINCKGCENRCNLTINIFNDGKRFVSGNKCEKGAGAPHIKNDYPNIYDFKRNKLMELKPDGYKQTIGIPLALSMYEMAPLWHTIFTNLGFKVKFTKFSTHKTYTKGQHTIPSDTVCYPAKLMHGHIEELLDNGVDAIFYPCLTYNFDEQSGDNHYNCPVVAYYSELLKSNVKRLSKIKFLAPYLNINNNYEFAKGLYKEINKNFSHIRFTKVFAAVNEGCRVYNEWRESVIEEGRRAIKFAEENNKRLIILAGRPYHVDPEICHLIDKLALALGFVVVSEDSIPMNDEKIKVDVLNQWTYHSRLYNAANYAIEHKNTELVQLVSFGCGIDAITTDEVKSILESNGKIYTQLKIDEINNLGAVKIRLRSLAAALEERENL